ncbi:penicillin-binding transpeptidase domain-containing protein [Desulfurobacterium atlanticum]|uniref:Penicillin binding protein transpeptidase domain-containing protein n=1 Tax=Desulfurobacterium atlanticum TaxID=240169 RepID=A0A238Z2R1_9BACT|nr:penicillin-binding transpeptidase domain-containing protein [Desulfurobacterium atlanticum]SNR77640.1 Penicillin binding protein transpeptidase domain-containing protein [Desulfurobacterium atlanticum]
MGKNSRYGFFAVLIILLIVLSPFIIDSSANIDVKLNSNFKDSGKDKVEVETENETSYRFFLSKLQGDFLYQFKLFKKAEEEDGRYVYRDLNGTEIVFTVKPELQNSIKREFKRYKLKYGAFVAIEPSTGKVLAAVSSIDYPDLTVKNGFVAASTFKIVTAAAALEKGISPSKKIVTRGHDDSCSPEVWFNSRYIIYRNMFHSFAYSSNPYFGVLGRLIGEDTLFKYAHAFGFNREDYNFPWGIIRKPLDDYDLALIAAGLGEVRVSPFHEALISATIENGGIMVMPSLIEEVKYKGKIIYKNDKPVIIGRVIKEKTAKIIKEMMINTVKFGTASGKKFFRRLRRYSFLTVGGKTGTLSQLNYPEGRCEWFTGFVENGDRKIAISSVAVNEARYYITGYDLSALAVLTMIREKYLFAQR